MRKKFNPDTSGQGSKLMNLFVLNLALCILVFLPLISEATYKIYLKNGRVMTGVNEIKEEGGKIKIRKYGIMLELPKADVIKIEEYNIIEPTEKETIEQEKTPAEEELPEYLRFDEKVFYKKQQKIKQAENRQLQQSKRQYQLILNKLKRIETLKKRSKELQKETHKKWSPRKARIARKEKAEIDKELEGLRMEKELLLKQKKELESQIGNLERK
jgi:hypothetical protein